jgi:ASC-1-like (ASCH) protein
MQEIGIESNLLSDILSGSKTIELRLGKPKFLKIRIGDVLSIREDVWKDGEKVQSIAERAKIEVTKLLYFESFEETFQAIDFQAAVPGTQSKAEALQLYRQFYSKEEEYEFGVVAIFFKVL